ncbi:hypoxanthine phosphoribosyltransferase [Ferrithrix thermotolerans DSM 19514]|jgi:hypoxanthine phosphoribosyltransferase|uniref:Hypoxanthine phosphoribosyltransferase n=1 Tax=Ferrithrix thermotolerans DSM 19514 TaxID=1121881 RepID=A0A1M4THJ4_9ACTN|nr:hypoxanthine phosphoribosyltransferase [Ferrithrix thermotolerans]SHE43972.1 hypoxanthine phosphoribosyltransferase [Ferrithrix thermotolerans DSM 19514]
MEDTQPDSRIGAAVVDAVSLQNRVRELGEEISKDFAGKTPLLIGVLKGAFMFMSDLAKSITVPVEFDFMAISSYGSATKSSGVVRILKDLDTDIVGRDVIVVEDIIESGLTLQYLLRNLRARGPKSLTICTLLLKRGLQSAELKVDYVGFDIPADFVVGYGLDVAERYRNLPYIARYLEDQE